MEIWEIMEIFRRYITTQIAYRGWLHFAKGSIHG
jgi:hypothetical protein